MKNWFIVAAPLLEPLPTVKIIGNTIKKGVGEVDEEKTIARKDVIPVVSEYRVYLPPTTSIHANRPHASNEKTRGDVPHGAIIAGSYGTESIAHAVAEQLNRKKGTGAK